MVRSAHLRASQWSRTSGSWRCCSEIIETHRCSAIARSASPPARTSAISNWWSSTATTDPPDFSEASARYTESRLSPLGEAAFFAERSERSALPIGLINGTVHLDGPTPPFDPHRIVAGLLAAHDGASDAALIDAVGSPSFPTGCRVNVDIAELAAGRHTVVRWEAHFDRTENGELVISRLPPRSSASDIGSSIERRVRRAGSDVLPVADFNDASFGSQARIVVRLVDGADPDSVARQLRDMWGVHATINVELEAPLPTVLRTWVDRHGDIDLRKQLQPIAEAAR